jgi:hypothetical protein
MTPFRLAGMYGRFVGNCLSLKDRLFAGTCCLHLQGRKSFSLKKYGDSRFHRNFGPYLSGHVFTVTAVRTSNRTQISYSYYFLHNNQTYFITVLLSKHSDTENIGKKATE